LLAESFWLYKKAYEYNPRQESTATTVPGRRQIIICLSAADEKAKPERGYDQSCSTYDLLPRTPGGLRKGQGERISTSLGEIDFQSTG
jgi:hypothetical protein